MSAAVVPTKTPKRWPWCALGVLILFSLPTATFLFSWYRPYLSEAFLSPAIDPLLTALTVAMLPAVIWRRASKVGRSSWLWAGLCLAGGLLILVHPLLGLAGSGLPALAYAATGLTSRTRQTSKRDTEVSWVLILVGGPIAFLFLWLSFSLAYTTDLRFGPPPYVSAQPAYEIVVRADLSGLPPEQRTGALYSSLKVILLRLKESTAGVVSARVGGDAITVKLHNTRNQAETIALVSSQGVLEVVDLGDEPGPAGETLAKPHRTVVSGLRLRIVDDWRYDPKLLLRDARASLDRDSARLTLGFDAEGAKALQDYTSASVGKHWALLVDDVVVASSRVDAAMSGGELAVGCASLEEARLVALKLRFGALPVPFSLSSVQPIPQPAG